MEMTQQVVNDESIILSSPRQSEEEKNSVTHTETEEQQAKPVKE